MDNTELEHSSVMSELIDNFDTFDVFSLPSLRGRLMITSFGWEGKGRYGSFR